MTLVLHRGATEIDYAGLRELETPAPTSSHVPIPHFRVRDLVVASVGMLGHKVQEECYGVTPDGMKFFGLLALRSPYTGYQDTVIMRNANDRSWPVGIGFGSRCFCCDNLAFIADHIIRRRHTANLKRDLPGLITELVEPLTEIRERQHNTMLRYQRTPLSDQVADHAIMRMYKEGVINVQRIPEVLKEWEEPTFDAFKDERNVWRLFNAATYVLDCRVTERLEATPILHRIADEICEMV